MRPKPILISLAALAALFVTLSVSSATTSAQTGGGYDLTWSTIDGGGGSSSGGSYSLGGTVGQPDAGTLSGGGYTLNGGFWPGTSYLRQVFLPLVVRGS